MKKILFGIIVITLIVFITLSTEDKKVEIKQKTLVEVVYGTVPVTIDSLFHVAYKKEYFQELGIDAKMQLNSSGKASLDNLFGGKADIIAVTATPIIYASFKRDDFVIIADIKHTDIHKGIARKSSNIKIATDLTDKKVAVMKGTSAEFFMDQYLAFNRVDTSNIDVTKSMNAPQKLQAFLDNKIDAFFCWEPFISKAKKALGDEAVILPNKDVFVGSWLIVVKKEFLENNKETVKNFLKALYKAEVFTKNNRDEAIKIHSQVVGIDLDIAKELFSKEGYRMKLDQSLLTLLEDQARWVMEYKYVTSDKIPNYLNIIDTKPLSSIDKNTVTILGY